MSCYYNDFIKASFNNNENLALEIVNNLTSTDINNKNLLNIACNNR